jgi:hypothetical protein
MPNQSHQNALHFLNAHIHLLDRTPVQHTRWYVSTSTFLLQSIETLQDNAFTVGEPIADIR